MTRKTYEPTEAFPIRTGPIRVSASFSEPAEPLTRHIQGDFGSNAAVDYLSCQGYANGGPMLSVHGDVCVLTEPDRGQTTIMAVQELPDYQFDSGQLDYVAEYADLIDFMLGEGG
jgi:hypothetical protein